MTTTPTDIDVRRYLLSQLTEEQTAEIDQALFADAELVSRVADVEHDLVDAYVAGELSAEDRSQFERHYLTSPVHLERLAVARALRASTLAKLSPRGSRGRSFQFGLFGWAAAAALLIAAAGIWLMVGRGAAPPDEQAQMPPAPVTPPTPSAPPSTPNAARDTSPSGTPAPPQAPSEPTTVALMLSPIQTRGAGDAPQLAVPANAERVELRIPGDDLDGLDAEIRSVDAGTVWTGRVTFERGAEARVLAPATSLPSGDYILSLSRAGTIVNRYYFRILRRD